MNRFSRAQALTFFFGAVALMTGSARADDDHDGDMHQTRNPGFVYRIAIGGQPGTIIITLKNDTGVPQRVFRPDPATQDEFLIVGERHQRVRYKSTPPLSGISVNTRGTTLQVGETLTATVDLAKWFALAHGERYMMRARGYVSYNPGSGLTTTFAYIDSNPIRFTY